MIYGYARVSTGAQDLTSQLAQLKAAGCEKVFREKITGTTADRPQLKKLMAALAPGDVVIIPAVDRLSRDTTDLMVIARDMQRAGAGLRSLAEPVLDTTGDFAELVLAMLGRGREAGTPPHRRANSAGPRRRQGEGREVRTQAETHAAPAARGAGTCRGGRDATQRRPQLQRRSGDDFEVESMMSGAAFRDLAAAYRRLQLHSCRAEAA